MCCQYLAVGTGIDGLCALNSGRPIAQERALPPSGEFRVVHLGPIFSFVHFQDCCQGHYRESGIQVFKHSADFSEHSSPLASLWHLVLWSLHPSPSVFSSSRLPLPAHPPDSRPRLLPTLFSTSPLSTRGLLLHLCPGDIAEPRTKSLLPRTSLDVS